jgi:hypothetical protein
MYLLAGHSGRAVLAGWLLGSWVRIPLKAWMFVRVFLCCVVLCRWRSCDGLMTRPRSPTICLNSSRNLLYVRRQKSKRTVEPQEKKKYFLAPKYTIALFFIASTITSSLECDMHKRLRVLSLSNAMLPTAHTCNSVSIVFFSSAKMKASNC